MEDDASKRKHKRMLERNAIQALESIPLPSMRRFANQSYQFMNAYECESNGTQAVWAATKYRVHRVLPESTMDDLEKAQKCVRCGYNVINMPE